MLEAMLPNMEANIAPLLCLQSVGNLGCTGIVLYLSLVKSCLWHDFHAIFQKFCIISIGTGMMSIATFEVKFKCCKSQVFCFW